MTDTHAPPVHSKRSRIRLLIGGATALVLAATSITLAGVANAEADRTLTGN